MSTRRAVTQTVTIFTALILVGCSSRNTMDCVEQVESNSVSPVNQPWVADSSASVFDQEILRTYNLTVAYEDLDSLQANMIEEEYVPAKLSVDGDTIGTVGIRYKGSRFTLEGCSGVREGEMCHKISMKLKFNKYDKELRFYGLKRLNFNSMHYDVTALHERLAYTVFADMGVPTSRATHARLVINGEYKGLFSLVEQIDGSFVKRQFPDNSDGHLYKERWPATDDSAYYTRGLRTNRRTANSGAFVDFYNELSSANDEELPTVISKYNDVDHLMRYMAVDRAISNWDGVTAFYPTKSEGFEGFVSHNYYWYQEEGKPLFTLLPWDMDGTMTVKTGFDHVPEWNEMVDDCGTTYSIFGGETIARAPTCDPFMRGVALLGEENDRYKSAMQEVLDGPFREGYLESKLDRWAEQIESSVAEDQYGPQKDIWEYSVANLRYDIGILRTQLENRINGVAPTPFYWKSIGVNDFEELESSSLHEGMFRYSNLRSWTKITLNTENPLSGSQDLRIDFDMYNEVDDPDKGAFSQWIWISSLFDTREKEIDLAAENVVGVRFTIAADREREFWISIKSLGYNRDSGGTHLGWQTDVDTTPRVVELFFKDGEFPFWSPAPEGYEVQEILKHVVELALSPVVEGTGESGVFELGDHDKGFVQVDDISFIVE